MRASELRYRRLFESAKDGILILDADTGKIVDVNPYLIELLDYSREDFLEKHVWDLGSLQDIVANRAKFVELSQQDYIRYDDKALRARDGRKVDVEFVSNVYLVDGRRVIQCNIRDMTERKRAQAALQASQHLTAEIINALPVRVFWKDRDLVYLGCNAAFARDAGLSDPADVIGKTDDQMVWRAQVAGYQADDRAIMASGEPRLLIEESQTTADGSTITLLTSKVPLRDTSGEITGILGTYSDISPLKRAQASEARLAMAVQQAAETIIITDVHGVILDVNPAFERASGYTQEEAIGRNPSILKSGKQDEEFYRRMWAALTRGEVWQGRMTNKRKDGTLFDEDVTISPIRNAQGTIVNFVAVKRDVTEQQRLELRLRRAQRMESIGTLAGGIAHDLNNALAPILMATELLRLEFGDSATEDLDIIRAGAQHGADLAKQLLNFARGAEGARAPVRLPALLADLERLIQSTFPKNIELRIHCPKDLPPILGDATQLHQVLLNLCVNARDAMPDGGHLVLDAGVRDVDASLEAEVLGVTPGAYVVVRIVDSGTGMSPDTVERIFDPFFTTKGPDKGTGLGLATTLGIVKGHGGVIRVYSSPGRGTTFTVYLPAQLNADVGAALPATPKIAFRGRGETILVVDDEAPVRDILRRVLTDLNFRVLMAADGTSALQEISTRGDDISIVITDLHMPHLGGLSFVRVLRSRLPDVGVIVASGLVDERERDQLHNLGVRGLINKPFTIEELVEALQEVCAH